MNLLEEISKKNINSDGAIGSPNSIEVKDLKKYFTGKKSFGNVKAVDGISFNVKKGEAFWTFGT